MHTITPHRELRDDSEKMASRLTSNAQMSNSKNL